MMARQKPGPKPKDVSVRFWDKVQKTDTCWLWRGALDGHFGYGMFHQTRGARRAHRVAWELTHGPIPAGLCVMHSCDVPACVNPAHLSLGSHADNNADMKAKGRERKVGQRGTENPAARLTERDVLAIRASSESSPRVAAQFGVSKKTVLDIRNGKTWRFLCGLTIERLTESGWKVERMA
jgi:hypothetical protein